MKSRFVWMAALTAVAMAAVLPIFAFNETASADGRVIILGFDGVDPDIVQTMMDAGELPHLKSLAEQGAFTELGSSNPPQSPSAWSSFMTSKYPGNHGVYDFLRRTPSRYMPGVGFGSVKQPKLGDDGSLQTPPSFETIRQGQSFWQAANEQGAKVKILSVPFAFPAEDLAESCMLSSLGVPDIRGTTSMFYLLSDQLTGAEDFSGGTAVPLNFENAISTVAIKGLRKPGTRDEVSVDITVAANRDENSVTITIPGNEPVTLNEGEWSRWTEWTFNVSPKYAVKAISRFHALEVGEQVRLYMACLQFHPDDPFIRFTTPPEYASELKDRYGFFKTIGWIYDTHALRQDALTEEVFLEDVRETMAFRERLTLDELDRGNFDLLVSAWTGTDRVGHLFWHHRDPKHPMYSEAGHEKYGRALEETYVKMDEIVGKVLEKAQENDLVMVISDHGFHSFRRGFNVNTWLIREGYLTVQGQSDPATATNPKPFLQGYDWSNSKAYSLGLGSIFLNLKGREGQGTVDPGDADALIAEIQDKLLALTDPETGEKVFTNVYTRDEYEGVAKADAPDLQLGYAEGYQSTKDAAKGSAPANLFEDNDDKWSGEHAASDVATTAGVFFSNKPIEGAEPEIVDIGVTALRYLGKEVPADFEGDPLF